MAEDLRTQLVKLALAWQDRYGVAPSITSAISEYDAAIRILGMTEQEFSDAQRSATAVRKGYDFIYRNKRYQIKANRPSGKKGSTVTLTAKAKNYDWDILIWILYAREYEIVEAWEWEVDRYRSKLHLTERIRPKDLHAGRSMWPLPATDLDDDIETLKANLPHLDEAAPPSPTKAMRQLERAHGKNEIAKAKGKRRRK